jgi:MFS family permease
VTRVRAAARTTFRSLRVRNYRIYFVAQIVSVSGTWMQSIAQGWLVLRLAPPGRAGVDLGIVFALQFLPMLLFGAYGGLIADRVDKRRLLYATQAAAGLLALVLGLLTAANTVVLWQVYLLALGLGFVNMFDNPARQTFVIEMVGKDDLPNAVSLNSVLMNGARVVGPAIGGILIATVGLAVCFLVNAASYVAVIIGLALMDGRALHRTGTVERARGQLRAGLHYVWRTPGIRDPLILVAVVGTLAYNFTVLLALFAKYTFGGGAGAYSVLTACMGAGAVIGGLVVAGRNRPNIHRLTAIGMVFGGLICLLAMSPTLAVAVAVVLPMGAFSIAFIATANATLQLRSDPSMRGRVMALYAIAFLGTTPIGAPLVGWISSETNPRAAFLVGGVATIGASAITLLRHRRDHARAAEALTRRAAGEGTEPGAELGVA